MPHSSFHTSKSHVRTSAAPCVPTAWRTVATTRSCHAPHPTGTSVMPL